MHVLPAIDLRHGRVVRLRQGDAARETSYADDPVSLLRSFAHDGAVWAHVVDLDAAFGEPPQHALLREIAGLEERPRLQLGGGLRDAAAVDRALSYGFERAVVGSLVAAAPELFAELARSRPQLLIPALDCRGDQVQVAGWRNFASLPAGALAERLVGLPCPALLVTDVERDGMLTGPNFGRAVDLSRSAGLPVLVSGGVRNAGDLAAAREWIEIEGVVVGRALLDGALSLRAALSAASVTGATTESR